MGTSSLGRPTLKEGERRDVVDRSCGAIAHISRDRERELSLNTFVCETDGGDSHQFVLSSLASRIGDAKVDHENEVVTIANYFPNLSINQRKPYNDVLRRALIYFLSGISHETRHSKSDLIVSWTIVVVVIVVAAAAGEMETVN